MEENRYVCCQVALTLFPKLVDQFYKYRNEVDHPYPILQSLVSIVFNSLNTKKLCELLMHEPVQQQLLAYILACI